MSTRERIASTSAAATTSASWQSTVPGGAIACSTRFRTPDATLTVEGSIQGLNLKEFFLLLSSTGLAYRRCELVRVNGTDMDIAFLKGKNGKKRHGGASGQDAAMA